MSVYFLPDGNEVTPRPIMQETDLCPVGNLLQTPHRRTPPVIPKGLIQTPPRRRFGPNHCSVTWPSDAPGKALLDRARNQFFLIASPAINVSSPVTPATAPSTTDTPISLLGWPPSSEAAWKLFEGADLSCARFPERSTVSLEPTQFPRARPKTKNGH